MNELGDFLSAKGFSVYVARVVGHGSKSEYLGKLSYKDWYDSLKYGYFTLMNTCKGYISWGNPWVDYWH